jgi:single-stranded-DNA-specific exonuclease
VAISSLFRRLLAERGVGEDFLTPKYEECCDPFLMPDIKKAVKRIEQAAKSEEKIVVYGDYDADGVTATALMVELLKAVGAVDVEVMLPDRFGEGYGLIMGVVEEIKKAGAGLVITVDCGSRDVEIVKAFKEAGIDVIVTDHHECLAGGELPEAVAVVNPKREDSKYPNRDLSGVGVVFKLVQAFVKRPKIGAASTSACIPAGQEKWFLDLVAVGTICDAMPLVGENRILTYFGLKVLEKTRRVGIKELMKASGGKKVDTYVVGFMLGPRLNAAGRMVSARKAYELLSTESRAEAAEVAAELNKLNSDRKAAQDKAVAEISEIGVDAEPVLVVRGEYHEGVIGIIAGRLVEKFRKPAFVFTEVADGNLRGSGRSFGEFSVAAAIDVCKEVIIKGGGHRQAGGVTVAAGDFEEFVRRINDFYRSLGLEGQQRFFDEEGDLEIENLAELTEDFYDETRLMEPFGEGNKEPVFVLKDMFVLSCEEMGKSGGHVRIRVRDSKGKTMKLVAFYAEKEWFGLAGCRADVYINLSLNEWGGRRNVEGKIVRVERRD